jgi:transcriptional regulator with XRE-family HTH domain
MTSAHRTVKILLLQKEMTFSDLAAASGLTQTTIHNTLSGRTGSQKARQAITNALLFQIWPDIQVTRRPIIFGPDVEIDSPTEAEAEATLRSLPEGYAERRGKTVFFLKEFEVYIPLQLA